MGADPLRNIWRCMVARCHRPNHPDFPSYGDRGITVCDRWRTSFEAFRADVGERPLGHTLDRIDNDRGYEPANVRWATRQEQAINRRDTVLHAWRGRRVTLVQIGRECGIHHSTVLKRLGAGMSMEEATTKPVDRRFGPRKAQDS